MAINNTKNKNDNPLVSIDIITYNHEKYISDAIEGVLQQNVNFEYEIVICDDCSTDNTRNILIDYQQRYPSLITLRLNKSNQGLKVNYFENKIACRGKYIAICEGDDYWTDPLKLQKQVDFMEQHPEYSMVFTNAMEVFDYQTWTKEPSLFCSLENRDYTGIELLLKWTVPTATVLFRNNIPYPFKHMDQFMFYDIPLFLRLCEYGKIRGINETTAIYRRHDTSITNQEFSNKKYLIHLKALNSEFEGKLKSYLPHLFGEQYYQLAKTAYKRKSLLTLYYAILSLHYDSSIITPLFHRKLQQLLKH
ncbi:MAG: glycosyltransferase [Bacteroidota bacterium]|nr:glycosyltransferase [Bacteroidota bacterium]